nr:hypothetical protein [Tanacetum cinerariifolium]
SEDENVFKPKEVKKTVKPSLEKIEFVKARNTTFENENKAKKPKKFSQSPRAAVLTKFGQVPVNVAKQSSHRATTSVSTASHESDGDDNQINDRFKNDEGYHVVPPPYTRNFMPRVDLSFAGLDNSVFKSKDQEIFNSRCSRHMNANKSYLTDYQEIDGGFVAFRGNVKGGKITGKVSAAEENRDNVVKSSACWI